MAQAGRIGVKKRATDFLINRGYIVSECIKGIIEKIDASCYQKSMPLENCNGKIADVYLVRDYDDADWYVKFFIQEGHDPIVEVWSCNWDGCMH